LRDASCSLDAVNSHVEPSPSHSCARRRPCTRQRTEQGRSQRHPEDEDARTPPVPMHPWWEARAIALAAHHRLLHDVSKAGRGDRAGVPGRPGRGAAARAHRAPTGGDARGLCRTSTLASDRSESRRHQKARSRVHGVRESGPSAVAQSGARAGGCFADLVGLWVEGRSRSIGGLGSRPITGQRLGVDS
jgi:hypothetical protein